MYIIKQVDTSYVTSYVTICILYNVLRALYHVVRLFMFVQCYINLSVDLSTIKVERHRCQMKSS